MRSRDFMLREGLLAPHPKYLCCKQAQMPQTNGSPAPGICSMGPRTYFWLPRYFGTCVPSDCQRGQSLILVTGHGPCGSIVPGQFSAKRRSLLPCFLPPRSQHHFAAPPLRNSHNLELVVSQRHTCSLFQLFKSLLLNTLDQPLSHKTTQHGDLRRSAI